MSKKVGIALLVIILLIGGFFFCQQSEKNYKPNWTQSSENLLKMKKIPKKPLTKKNLFE